MVKEDQVSKEQVWFAYAQMIGELLGAAIVLVVLLLGQHWGWW